MKRGLVGLSLLLTISLIPANSATPPKVGLACSKKGTTKTYLGKKFTWIKSGKRLVWSKGVVVKKSTPSPFPYLSQTPTPSPSPTPTPSPTPSLSPTQSPLPTPSTSSGLDVSEPLAFSNLLKNTQNVASQVWPEIQKNSSQGLVLSSFKIAFGPNTTLPKGVSDPVDFLSKASQLWSGFRQPSITKVYLFNFKDLAWAQEQMRSLNGSWFKPEQLAANCISLETCGSFGGTFQGTGQLFLGIPVRERYNANTFHSNFVHEFTHAVQYYQVPNYSTVNGYALLPCWFSEGQPMVSGEAIGNPTLPQYQGSRLNWLKTPAGVLGDYSPNSFLSFFAKTGIPKGGGCQASFQPRVYDIGYLAVEALTAIGGLESTMRLVNTVTGGLSFEDGFKEVYGITWSNASVVLSEYLSLIYQGTK